MNLNQHYMEDTLQVWYSTYQYPFLGDHVYKLGCH